MSSGESISLIVRLKSNNLFSNLKRLPKCAPKKERKRRAAWAAKRRERSDFALI
jgi:hypothetical protein